MSRWAIDARSALPRAPALHPKAREEDRHPQAQQGNFHFDVVAHQTPEESEAQKDHAVQLEKFPDKISQGVLIRFDWRATIAASTRAIQSCDSHAAIALTSSRWGPGTRARPGDRPRGAGGPADQGRAAAQVGVRGSREPAVVLPNDPGEIR